MHMRTITAAIIAILVISCDCVSIQHPNHHTIRTWRTSPQHSNCAVNTLILPTIESMEDAMIKLPNLFHIIKQHNLLISPLCQLELSKYYIILFNKLELNELSQKQLINLIQLIIYQNNEIGLHLQVSVWNQFFYIYYRLKQGEYRDSYVFKLLQCMNLNGSNCQPNLQTFVIILAGMISNHQIQLQVEYFNYIIDTIMPKYNIIPNPQIYHLQFRLFINKRDINGITKLLFDHPNIIFPDTNIQIFNAVLANLPNYVQHERDIADSMMLLMNGIMVKTHKLESYDNNTYHILRKLYDEYPFLYDTLQNIDQPFSKIYRDKLGSPGHRRGKREIMSGHNDVYRILQRMKQVQLGYNTEGYVNYNRFVRPNLHRNDPELNTPNAAIAKSKSDWDAEVKHWRRKLHEYDKYSIITN